MSTDAPKARASKVSAASLVAKARARAKQKGQISSDAEAPAVRVNATSDDVVPKVAVAPTDQLEFADNFDTPPSPQPLRSSVLEADGSSSLKNTATLPISPDSTSDAKAVSSAPAASSKPAAATASRGRTLLQSALSKNKVMGQKKSLGQTSSSSDNLSAMSRQPQNQKPSSSTDSVQVTGLGLVSQSAGSVNDLENMLELCDESDFPEEEKKPVVETGSNATKGVSAVLLHTKAFSNTASAPPPSVEVPKQTMFTRMASLTNDLTESLVHVSMTDYTNPLLELAPLRIDNPCMLLRMSSVSASESSRDQFSDAAGDVDNIVKNLQELKKSGTAENFQVLFSRASKLCQNARSNGVIQSMFAKSGICELIVSLIGSRMSERPVISSSLDFIYEICTEKSNGTCYIADAVASFISAGIVKVVVDVLQKYAVHETICEHAMDVLSLFLIRDDHRQLVSVAGACHVCCIVLRESMTSYPLVRKTCTAIMCLAQDAVSAQLLVDADAVEVLLCLISSCSDTNENYAIWAASFAAISELAVHGGEDVRNKLILSDYCGSYLNLLAKLKLDSAQNTDTVDLMLFTFCKLYTIPYVQDRFKHENMCQTLHSFVERHVETALTVSIGSLALAVLFHWDASRKVSISKEFCPFYAKLVKKYRSTKTEAHVIGCIYQLLVMSPELSMTFHKERLTQELVSALVNAVNLERELSTRKCDKSIALETTSFTVMLCGTFYVLAANSEVIRREFDKINACGCFVAFLTLIHGRGTIDADESARLIEPASENESGDWFDCNNDVLFSSCLSCISVMYLPNVYSAHDFMLSNKKSGGALFVPQASSEPSSEFQTGTPCLLSESNYLSLMTILPQFWVSQSNRVSANVGSDLASLTGASAELRLRKIEMLCWTMYHLSVACPVERMYTIREKCIGLIRYANTTAINGNSAETWRCLVPFSYLLLSCCVDEELTEELLNQKIFSSLANWYERHMENPDALCALNYVVSELLVKYDAFKKLFFEMFSNTTLLRDIVRSVDIFGENHVLTYNVFMLLARVLSLNNAMIFPLISQLSDSGMKVGDILARGIDQFGDHPEVILSIFHFIYCVCPEFSTALGVSKVPEIMCRHFAKGSLDSRSSIYACLAIAGLCATNSTSNDSKGVVLKRMTRLDANEDNQSVFFASYACDFISSLFTEFKNNGRVLEAAAVATIHLTKLRKIIRLEPSKADIETQDDRKQNIGPPARCARKFIDQGCVDSLLDSLNAFGEDTELLVRSCGALRALCLADAEATLTRLDSLNSSGIFVSLLNTHGSNIPAMCAICDVTQCLAKIAVHSYTLQDLGVRQTLNVAAVINNSNPIALKAIIGLIVALISSDPTRSQLDINDVNIFVLALKMHPQYPPLVALAGQGIQCVAKVAHREDSLKDALHSVGVCDVIVDCLELCLSMSKKNAVSNSGDMERQLFKTHAKGMNKKEEVEDLSAVFDPTETLADAVSGLASACGELAAGEMYDNRLRFQSKAVVNVLSQLVGVFAVHKRTANTPIGSILFGGDGAAGAQPNLSISSRCSEMLCFAVHKLSLLDSMRDAFIVAGMCENILDILTRHLEGGDISYSAMGALRQLVISQQGNVGSIRLISQKACVVVHQALLRHMNNARNVLVTLWLMKLLSLVAAGREDFADLNVVDAVLLAMDTHPRNVLVNTQALWVYRNIGQYDSKKNLDQLCRDQFCASIVAAMTTFSEDNDIAEAACATTQMICKYSLTAKEFFISKGMCSLLASCAAGLCPNDTSMIHCLQSIRELCEGCADLLDTVLNELTSAGIHAALSKIMFDHISSLEVAENAFCVQLIMLRHDASKHAKIFSQVNGYSEYLTALLLRYVMSEQVCLYGCEVFLLLCTDVICLSQLAHDGAPAALLSAFQQHDNNPDMCRIVTRAIAHFCVGNAENTVSLSLRGVCEVTAQMLQRFEESVDLVKDIVRVILVISTENDVCKRRYFDYGTGTNIMRLLERHSADTELMDLCCKLIISMCSNPVDSLIPATELRNLGLTFVLDGIISQHIHDAALCEVFCIAMAKMLVAETGETTVDPVQHNDLLSNAGSFRNVLNTHAKSAKLATVCCDGIALLASRRTLLLELGNLSICEPILKAWRIHLEDDNVVGAVCIAVEALARIDSNRTRLASHDFYGLASSSITLRGKFENNPLLLAQILFAVNETTREHADNAESFLGCGFFEVVATNLGSQKNITILTAVCQNIVLMTAMKGELAMLFGASGACGYVTRILHHLCGLKEDPEIRPLCVSSLSAACTLCTYGDNLALMKNANLFGAIDSVLSSFSDNVEAGVLTCKIIKQFLNREADDFTATQSAFGSLKISQKIIFCAMDKNHANDTTGLSELYSTLTELCWQHEGNIQQILSVDAVQHVISMVESGDSSSGKVVEMSATTTDILATSNCCELLGVMCYEPMAQNKIREALGCLFVVRAFAYTVSKRHIECTVQVLEAISLIIKNNPANQEVFVKSELIPSLVIALDGWLECPAYDNLVLIVLNLLCNCGTYDDNISITSKIEGGQIDLDAVSSLRLAGVFECIFTCMSRNAEEAEVLTQACWAINNLSADNECIARLGSSGGCDAIVMALSRHVSSNLPLLQAACIAINVLCDQTSNAMSLGVSAVYDAIYFYGKELFGAYGDRLASENADQVHFYKEELSTLIASCMAICALCKETLKARSALAEVGMCDLLPKLLAALPDPVASSYVCRAICAIFEDIPENVILFDSADIIKIILDIIVRIMNSSQLYTAQFTPDFIVEVCKTLRAFLTGNPVLCEKTGNMGGCHSIIEMSNKYRGNKFVMVECSGLVCLLGGVSEESSRMFSETGVHDIALDILLKQERGEYITRKDTLSSVPGLHVQDPSSSTGGKSSNTTLVSAETRSDANAIEGSHRGSAVKVKNSAWAAGACTALVEALRSQLSSVTATQQNCAAIAKLAANDPENARTFVELGVVETLSGLMRKHLGVNVPILVETLNVIYALCFRTPENVPQLLQLGLCESTCIAYRRHHNDAGIAIAATKAIYSLSISEELSTTLGVAGACQSVCRSLQESVTANSTELVDMCCRAMTRLMKDNLANHEQFTGGGACQLLATAVGLYMTENSSVLESVLWALASMCRYGLSIDTEDQSNCEMLLNLHVDSSLVYVLSCFGNAPEIMEAVCTSISNMCYSDAAAESFGGLGTCKVLVDLTKSHLAARNFPILVPTVSALANLSPVGPNVQLLLQYGVLETLTSIVKSQTNQTHAVPILVDRCCVCLQNICNGRADVSLMLGSLGICQPFYKLIEMYQHHPELNNGCNSLMSNLFTFSWFLMLENKKNSQEFCDLNIHLLYIERLLEYEGDASVVYPVLGGCNAVSTIDKASVMLVEAKLCPRLVSLLRRYVKRVDMVQQICGTISHIVTQDTANCLRFDECEVCDALIACMRRHIDSSEMAIIICQTIADLAKHEVTCENLGRSGACESVVEALQRFSGNDEVAFPACRAVSQLAFNEENVDVLCELNAYEWIITSVFLSVENTPLVIYATSSLTLLNSAFRKTESRSVGVDLKKLCEVFVTILEKNIESPLAVENVCNFIKCLSDDSSARVTLGSYNVTGILANALTLYTDHAATAKSILKAIAGVALKNEANKSSFSEVKVGVTVLDTMRSHWKDSSVLENALFCITTLSFGNVVNTSTFGTSGACELVLKAVADYAPKNARIAAVGCQAIFCLSKGEGNLDRFDICGGVDTVADILEMYIDNEKVVRHTCSALAALGQSNVEVKEDQVVVTMSECSERVCVLIFKAFEHHLSNSVVMRAIVAAIGALAESVANANFFCKTGVCACLLTAMAQNKDAVQNCADIMDTMERLARHTECIAAEEFANQIFFGNLVDIFDFYSEDAVIHETGCKLLLYIARTKHDELAIVAIESVVRMLSKFVMEENLLALACSYIEITCRDCRRVADSCGNASGARQLCDALEESLRHHSSNSDVLCGIFRAMLALCVAPQLVMFFATGTNSKMLLHSLAVYINDAALVRDICLVLTALTHENATNKIEFASIDSIKLLLRALSIHKLDFSTSPDICAAIYSLCDMNKDNCVKLIDLRGGDVLLDLASIHKTSVDVCGNVFSVLADVAMLQKSMVETLQATNIRQHIMSLLVDHPKHAKFVLGAMRLLRVLYQIETQENATLLNALDGECRILVQALNNHTKELNICCEICGAVSFLALNEECAKDLGEKGICVSIRMRITDATAAVNTKLLQSALLCITVLCRGSDDVRNKLCEADTCRALVRALSISEDKGAIEKLVMNCIASICGGANSTREEQKMRMERMLEAEACESVCMVLEKRLAEPNLVAAPCSAAASLARFHPSRDSLIRLGAPKLLVHVLKEYVTVKPLAAQFACSALSLLCSSKDGHRAVMEAPESLAAVAKVLQVCPENATLATEVCRLVRVLAKGHADIGVSFFTLGACQSIMKILSSASGTMESTTQCMNAISALCAKNPVVLECFVSGGTGKAVVASGNENIANLELSTSALKVIVTFGSVSRLSDAVKRLNLVDVYGQDIETWCVEVCAVHMSDPDICFLVCKLYGVFAQCGINIVHEFCTHAVHILVNFIDNDRIATAASDAFVHLGARGDEPRRWLLDAGAAAACINVLQKEEASTQVSLQICNIVQFMAAEVTTNMLISEAGACEKVATIFESQAHDPEVMGSISRAIVELVENNAENEVRLEVFDVCKLLRSSFRKFLSGTSPNLSVCAEICGAIEVMAADSEANTAKFTMDSGLMNLLAQFMSRRFAENGDCTSCCRAVAVLAQDAVNSGVFGRAGLCETLTVILTKNKHNVTYCFYILSAVYSLCHSATSNIEAVATPKFCKALLAILQDNATQSVIDDHLTLIAMKVLCFVSSIPDCRLVLGSEGACALLNKYVSAVIPKGPVSTEIFEFTLLVISTLCNSDENQKAFGNSGTCEMVCNVLRRHIEEVSLLTATLSAVANLCRGNIINGKLLFNANIINLLVDSLNAHTDNALVNELAARVIQRLSVVAVQVDSGLAEAFATSSLCNLIVGGLKNHIRARNVNIVICAGIRSMADLSPQVKLQLGVDQVCPELCKAVELGLSVADDQLLIEAIEACTSVISDSCCNQECMGTAGLCELLADVCNKKMSNDAVLEKVLCCVAGLCRCGVEPITASVINMARFAATNFGDNVVSILKNNISSLEVIRMSFITIRNMCANEQNLARIVGIGGCEALCTTLRRLLHNERVCESACGAVAMFSTTDSYRKLVFLGAIDLITLILQRYPDNIGIVFTASTGVINLCRDYDNKRQFAQKGICGVYARVLLKHGHLANIAEEASTAVWNLSANCPENKILLGAAGACEAVVSVLKSHPGNLVVGKAATGALNSLMEGNGTNAKRIADAGGEKLRVSSMSTVEWRSAPGEVVSE